MSEQSVSTARLDLARGKSLTVSGDGGVEKLIDHVISTEEEVERRSLRW